MKRITKRMKTLIITHKPSWCKLISEILDDKFKKEHGYIEGDKYIITSGPYGLEEPIEIENIDNSRLNLE